MSRDPADPTVRPERIPLVLAAVEREWRKAPDLRLGELLVRARPSESPRLSDLPDGELLRSLGPETEEEERYMRQERIWIHFTSHEGDLSTVDPDTPITRPISPPDVKPEKRS